VLACWQAADPLARSQPTGARGPLASGSSPPPGEPPVRLPGRVPTPPGATPRLLFLAALLSPRGSVRCSRRAARSASLAARLGGGVASLQRTLVPCSNSPRCRRTRTSGVVPSSFVDDEISAETGRCGTARGPRVRRSSLRRRLAALADLPDPDESESGRERETDESETRRERDADWRCDPAEDRDARVWTYSSEQAAYLLPGAMAPRRRGSDVTLRLARSSAAPRLRTGLRAGTSTVRLQMSALVDSEDCLSTRRRVTSGPTAPGPMLLPAKTRGLRATLSAGSARTSRRPGPPGWPCRRWRAGRSRWSRPRRGQPWAWASRRSAWSAGPR
jgi:hypothetical protein